MVACMMLLSWRVVQLLGLICVVQLLGLCLNNSLDYVVQLLGLILSYGSLDCVTQGLGLCRTTPWIVS